jgi:tripartite-type tricarboxylate transporter receptor subunit TctC
MKIPSKYSGGLAGISFFISLYSSPSNAQDAYPNKAVKIIVPYAPGGAVDVVTRKVAQKLTEQTKQVFFVENKAGATGTIGVNQVAKSDPDGYTLVANDTTYSLLPHIFKNLPFDPNTDLQAISAFVFVPMGLVVSSESKYKTLNELITEARKEPNKITYGTGGSGTTPHFVGEAFGIAANANFMAIPFKGAAEATQAVLSNSIDFQFASTTGLMGNVKAGKLRMLGISGDKRILALPNVPTFTESGLKWQGLINWTGLWAPKGTPAPVITRLQKEIAIAMTSPDMKAFAESMGAEPKQIGSDSFAKILKDSTETWGKIAANSAFEKQ